MYNKWERYLIDTTICVQTTQQLLSGLLANLVRLQASATNCAAPDDTTPLQLSPQHDPTPCSLRVLVSFPLVPDIHFYLALLRGPDGGKFTLEVCFPVSLVHVTL